MKKKIFILLSAVLGLAIIVNGCGSGSSNSNNTAPKAVKQVSNTVEATGIVKSAASENIVMDAAGSVVKVNVQEGQKVKRGDVLFSLNLSDANSLINSKAQEIDGENSVLRNLKRDREVLNRNVDTSDQAVQTSVSSIPSPNKNDLKYEKDNEIKAENDKISALQNDLQALKNKLNKSFLKGNDIQCDIDNGIVSEIGYKQGDIINPGIKFCTIYDIGSMSIEAKIDEQFIKDVAVGKSVTIIPTADPSKKYNGKVKSIAAMATTVNGETFVTAIISIDNNDGFLMPNYNVDLEINK